MSDAPSAVKQCSVSSPRSVPTNEDAATRSPSGESAQSDIGPEASRGITEAMSRLVTAEPVSASTIHPRPGSPS